MTTLAANIARPFVLGTVNEVAIIAADIIYEGAAVGAVAGTGHARPLVAGDKFIGFAQSICDNSAGAAAAKRVMLRNSGCVSLAVSGAVITDKGQPVYATDDNVFVFLPTGASFIGFVRRFVSAGVVEVEFDVNVLKDPYGDKVCETLAASTLTLDVQDNAKYVFVTVDTTITLPATATLIRNWTVVNMGPFGTVAIVLTPNGSDKIAGANIAPADGATVTNTKATARRGDFVSLDFGGTDGPAITQISGIWAAA